MLINQTLRATILLCVATAGLSLAAQEKPKPCALPQYRQLDFWIGDFDAFDLDAPGKVAARAHISGILGACVVHEDYQQIDGLHGESFSIYDASRGVWHQTWVTNFGQLLELEGKYKDGALTLSGEDHRKKSLVRVSWTQTPGYVRERAETSSDHGKTWTMLFDMGFRPHK